MARLLMVVDYDEYKPKTYRGVVIYDFAKKKEEQEVVRVCTNNIEWDTELALHKLRQLMVYDGEEVICSSSFDNYAMDLEHSIGYKLKQIFKRRKDK